MILYLSQVAAGLLLLYIGAEALVRGSTSLAARLRISPLIIGLTIVAFGTSMPELVVSIKASLTEHGALSIGNVIGSNIMNIAVILGLSAIIYPLKTELKFIRVDAPLMIGVTVLFSLFFMDRTISRIEGTVFVILICTYLFLNIYQAKRATRSEESAITADSKLSSVKNVYVEIALILVSFVVLTFGADLLVAGASAVASLWGASEAVIGLTIVALGTSLPELATSVVAAARKNPDIAIGNIIGSNIFNILAILGIASMIHPIRAPGVVSIHLLVMTGFSVILLPFMWTKFQLQRWEGVLLVTGYILYAVFLLK